MNQLSQLLYWADVLPTFASWMLFLLFWVMLALIAAFIGNRIAFSNMETNEDDAAIYRGTAFSRWLLPIVALIWSSLWFIPSKETFYAIAASEMGEQALKSPIMTKAGKALSSSGSTSSSMTVTMLSLHQHKGQQARRVLHQQKVRVMRRAKDDGYTLDQLQRLGRFKHRQSLIKFLERNGINSPSAIPAPTHST